MQELPKEGSQSAGKHVPPKSRIYKNRCIQGTTYPNRKCWTHFSELKLNIYIEGSQTDNANFWKAASLAPSNKGQPVGFSIKDTEIASPDVGLSSFVVSGCSAVLAASPFPRINSRTLSSTLGSDSSASEVSVFHGCTVA